MANQYEDPNMPRPSKQLRNPRTFSPGSRPSSAQRKSRGSTSSTLPPINEEATPGTARKLGWCMHVDPNSGQAHMVEYFRRSRRFCSDKLDLPGQITVQQQADLGCALSEEDSSIGLSAPLDPPLLAPLLISPPQSPRPPAAPLHPALTAHVGLQLVGLAGQALALEAMPFCDRRLLAASLLRADIAAMRLATLGQEESAIIDVVHHVNAAIEMLLPVSAATDGPAEAVRCLIGDLRVVLTSVLES